MTDSQFYMLLGSIWYIGGHELFGIAWFALASLIGIEKFFSVETPKV